MSETVRWCATHRRDVSDPECYFDDCVPVPATLIKGSLADDPQAVERAAQTICDWRVALHHEPGEVSPYTGDRALAERVLRAAEGEQSG